nr:unnamed protein product [Callosobruchus chinensis]
MFKVVQTGSKRERELPNNRSFPRMPLNFRVATPKEVMNEWQLRPQILVARYIKKYLQNKGRISFDGHGSIAVKSPRRFKLVQQESQSIE